MNGSAPLLLCLSILALYGVLVDGEGGTRPPASKCMKAMEDACAWVDKLDTPLGEVHMGKACPSSPHCGCIYHAQCQEKSSSEIVVFLCKNKKTGISCSKDPQDTNGNGYLGEREKEQVISRRRRETAPSDNAMNNIPPVLRKIINRHRLQNPQSFGAGTFFLSGFSHINETLLLKNVVDAHKMQDEHNPPDGHKVQGQKVVNENSSTEMPTSTKATQQVNPTISTTSPEK